MSSYESLFRYHTDLKDQTLVPITAPSIKREKVRDSNLELLRIIAMILVMVVHASFESLGHPSLADLQTTPMHAFFRFLSESIGIICVNVFVLISGWYGIRAKIGRLSAFIFQVLFFGVVMYFGLLLFKATAPMGLKGWMSLLVFKDLWFVKAYLVLYIFAPILNAFIEKATKKDLKWFLIAFFFLQTLHGCITSSNWFSDGYSPLSFMGLYVLARYLKLYPNRFSQQSKFMDSCIYGVLTLLTTVLPILFIVMGYGMRFTFYSYSSPLIILASVYFLLFFTKLNFQSSWVNWIAISSFGVYLFHCDIHFLQPIYVKTIVHWFRTESTWTFLLYTSLWIALLFMLAIIVDKLRIQVWNFCVVKRPKK